MKSTSFSLLRKNKPEVIYSILEIASNLTNNSLKIMNKKSGFEIPVDC